MQMIIVGEVADWHDAPSGDGIHLGTRLENLPRSDGALSNFSFLSYFECTHTSRWRPEPHALSVSKCHC